MPSALSIIGALTIAAIGGAGVYEFDRHPPVGFHAHVLFWHPGFDLPDSLQTRLEKAVAAAHAAQDGLSECRTAIGAQNASIAATAAAGAAALAQAQAGLDRERAHVLMLQDRAAGLRAFVPSGAGECQRWESADRAVVGALK